VFLKKSMNEMGKIETFSLAHVVFSFFFFLLSGAFGINYPPTAFSFVLRGKVVYILVLLFTFYC
jgi:hypothetical protein